MEKPKKGDILNLDITEFSYEGKGIGKTDDNFVIFVDNAVIGDKVKVSIQKVKKNYAEAKITEIIQTSDMRITPKCIHYYVCNGCKLQQTDYEMQLEIKRKNVLNSFQRIGGFEDIEIPSPIGSYNIYHYRNKVEFSFSNDRWLTDDEHLKIVNDKNFALGYHRPGFAEKVIDIYDCLLQIPQGNEILNFTREFFKKRNVSIYSTRTHEGFLRYLIIRKSTWLKELMVILVTHEEDKVLMDEFTKQPTEKYPFVSSLINMISTTKAQVASGDRYNILHGSGHLEERLGNFIYRINPDTFFQTNSLQAKVLFDTVIRIGEFNKDERVLDLYCGSGAISIYISEHVNSVFGVEENNSAVELARLNVQLNLIKNCKFEKSDVKEYLKKLSENKQNECDTYVIDPPRSGMHPKAVEYINILKPKKIVYVSCNPSTQARDIKELAQNYEIIRIQPVDMFPQTYHIENIVILKLKNNN